MSASRKKSKTKRCYWRLVSNHGEDALDKATAVIALRAEHLRQNAQLVLLKPISFTQLAELARRFHPTRNRRQSG